MTHIAVRLGKITRTLGVRASYGDAVQVGGSTVVPVALVGYGFGGGGDRPDESGDFAGGGGGGGGSIPVGAYVAHGQGAASFEPNVIALVAVSTPLVVACGVSLARVVRALKK